MKNTLSFALLSILAVTACTPIPTEPTPVQPESTVEVVSETALAFPFYQGRALPNGWFMKEGERGEILIENTEKTALWGGVQPDDFSEEKYATEKMATIRVTELSLDAFIPPVENFGFTDLGGGFSKVKTCDDVTYPECNIYGTSSYTYFWERTNGEKYQFNVNSRDVAVEEIEAVILSFKD